ncbi:MAG: oligopeptidase A [Gammaproteobacteria bacterium]|jgi:oligopeptidase A
MSNPLIDFDDLPPFSKIRPEHVEPAVEQVLRESKQQIDKLASEISDYNWDNFIQPLEDIEDRINKTWSPVSHLNAVTNNETLREAYNNSLSKMTEFHTELSQDKRIYNAYHHIKNSDEFATLDGAQQKTIDDALRDFHLSGIDLPEDKQQRFKAIKQQLSKLTSQFSDNVLDATNAWHKHIDDESLLSGLPDSATAMVKQNAEQHDQQGWRLTLDFPCFYAVMSYADNRDLRKEMHDAYVTRASDQGPHAGQWDNSAIMEEILALRHELAQLLNFANYAEYSLATKMANSTDEVMQFLHDLAAHSKPYAEKDLQEVKQYAQEHHNHPDLQPWDIGYYSEKLRQHKYAITQEELKPYFPEPVVLKGLFDIVNRLYGLKIQQVDGVDTWHKDVKFFEIRDEQDRIRGKFFIDLYARANKRGGAWMAECISRKKVKDQIQTPVAYLTCNFSPPIGDEPALFTHTEVLTLFHEFGHGLHHMLTQVDYISVSGISGVAWDAVELPSQFMENFCWEKESIDLMARHYQTSEPLPNDLFEKMTAAKNYQSGMQMVRQLEFALFDFRLHLEYKPGEGAHIQQTLDEVRNEVAVVKPAPYNRFQHGFSHIFAGGYAAGYYSYKWAEVLSADAFSKFEETGIFNRDTGNEFLHAILEKGGSKEPMDLFVEFRGRKPTIDALLRHSGIAA